MSSATHKNILTLCELIENKEFALEALTLDLNNISKENFVSFFKSLQKNMTLKYLDPGILPSYLLYDLDIRFIIAQTLKLYNTTLQTIKVFEELYEDVASLLDRNKKLADPDLDALSFKTITDGMQKERSPALLNQPCSLSFLLFKYKSRLQNPSIEESLQMKVESEKQEILQSFMKR